MEVILAETIANLGDEGEVVKVKGGYARNYLIPQGLAYTVSSANASDIAHKKKMLQDKRKRLLKTEKDLADRLHETVVKIHVKAGEEDRLFGSVTSKDIAASLSEKGLDIDRRKIQLDEPIKALGVFTIPIRLSAETTADVRVFVEKEQ
ncbi:MAG: 50S ribosomal protein L9 [bacterium]|nr:50S ribosomal protein L9 [bacterium]